MTHHLDDLAARDNALMRVLKLTDMSHLIAKTNKGDFCMKLPYKGSGKDYVFVLDSVPYTAEESADIAILLKGVFYINV